MWYDTIKQTSVKGALFVGINKELSQREFIQRETGETHSPYEKELEFYSAVAAGNIERVRKLYTPLAVEGYGKLSDDPVRNVKYHLTITIALIARFCIEKGLPTETSYTISDIFINRLDVATDIHQLEDIHREVFIEYAKRMQKVNSGNAYSKHVLMCLDIIYDNIYNGVRVQEIADRLGLTPQYLSKLFKQEVGMTISEYIMSRRIQAAENMLKFSEYTPLDIGNYLNFSSHSHFIACFRKHTGLTPKQYRENYFRISWQHRE
ncbi:helix-turn-helix domain-containing protein [Ruminococcus albus]|jgi:AraC-like DNA-binding protein|uniref:helix-turn-helix domain-containing protein n=1 Tax=Ruminococcus albus TaxID=1264 RepID=UPI0004B613DA|nr:helix-turn-helix domain-containing protein [Ruminococcus albus]MBE6869243.1 helix-turn-helix domain-containing protein [Ruminococcus albus]